MLKMKLLIYLIVKIPEQVEETESEKGENNSAEDESTSDSVTDKGSDITLENTEESGHSNNEENVEVTEETTDNVALKVDLPQTDAEPVKEVNKEERTDNKETVNEGACSSRGVADGGQTNTESIHQVKWVYFKKKQVPIITQNENGPCPLLALINVLLLQNRVVLPARTEIISAGQLMAHLGDCVLQNVPGEDVHVSCFDQ